MVKNTAFWLCFVSILTFNVSAKNQSIDPFSSVVTRVSLDTKEKQIFIADYKDALGTTIRSTFYHGKAPENEVAEVKKQVEDEVLRNTLLWLEYDRKAMQGLDTANIVSELEKFSAKYSELTNWPQLKDKILPVIERRLTRNAIAVLMEKQFKEKVQVSQQDAHAFYLKNPQLFTEPERSRASIILLEVAPSSSQAVWDTALERAREIKSEIKSSAEFAESAELYSSDISADQGGDMGFMHQGQLDESAQNIIDNLAIGDVSEPLILLEGVALFMVSERLGATHHTFEEVSKRATQLAIREKAQQGWQHYLKQLSSEAKVIQLLNSDGSSID